jgi:hypothetical protein
MLTSASTAAIAQMFARLARPSPSKLNKKKSLNGNSVRAFFIFGKYFGLVCEWCFGLFCFWR